MLVNFIGTRGTHPASGQGTMSFIVDNKVIFDMCPEFVMSHNKLVESWNKTTLENIKKIQNLYGVPSFSKIEHIFLTHFHFDHWGGLRHFLIWSQMFESSFREEKPLHIYVPRKNLSFFQLRLKELFQLPDDQHFDDADFFLRYLIVEIDVSLIKYVKIHPLEDKDIVQIGNYQVQACENKHFKGSLSYKLISTKYKLREEQLEKYGIKKGPILSKLQKEKEITIDNKTIQVEDIFIVKKTILGYSGDTTVDKDLLQFFKDCTHLIHESTYFEDGEFYHTDAHASLKELIHELQKFPNLKCFLPVHFSGRYTWEEIKTAINKLDKELPNVLIYPPKLGSVVYYEDKDEKTTIEELVLLEKY